MDAEEHDRLAERETILAAMLAAAERLHELVDVVQTAPSDDATLLHEVAALLACDEAARAPCWPCPSTRPLQPDSGDFAVSSTRCASY